MPHVIVKLWTGKSERQKARIADAVTKAVMASTGYGEESVSVSIEEFEPGEWTEKVYEPDILGGPGKLYKKSGYNPPDRIVVPPLPALSGSSGGWRRSPGHAGE